MKKAKTQSFLYKYRFYIGYGLLLLAFFSLLSFLPSVAPNGLSNAEMESAIHATHLSEALKNGDIINLPYYFVQKLCLESFGLSLWSIKLASMLFGVFTALFIVLLINRWFKSDVAIFGSILTILSTAFLFQSTSGTPVIMYLFWISLILWLGSKIVGAKKISPTYILAFFVAVSASAYTPHLAYVAIAIAIASLVHPHLRFAMTQIKKWQSIAFPAIAVLILLPLIVACIGHQETLQQLLLTNGVSFRSYVSNISTAYAPFFSFSLPYDSIYLAPLFGISTIALIFIGAIATLNNPFTARNTVVDLLILFSIIFAGFNPNIAILIVIPIAILSAAGIESIFKKWHSLFPNNPYAHFIGNMPVLIVILMIVVSGLTHFIYGYHYTPIVAKNFNNDVELVNKLERGSLLVVLDEEANFEFFKLFAHYKGLRVTNQMPDKFPQQITLLGKASDNKSLKLKQIITSPKSRNSARLYIYTL